MAGMAGHGRHRLARNGLLRRGIYWGTRTTRATAAMVVACVAVILMAALPNTAAPAPAPTVAQQSLPAAVAAWKERAATATFTTAPTPSQADSDRQAERKPAKRKSNGEG